MRFIKTLLTSLGLVLLTSANAGALMLQDPAIKVDVSTSESHSTWYASPVWLAIGGLALLLIIVAIMASRRKSTTTVVRYLFATKRPPDTQLEWPAAFRFPSCLLPPVSLQYPLANPKPLGSDTPCSLPPSR
jgi:uncharacterized integral membrane protein